MHLLALIVLVNFVLSLTCIAGNLHRQFVALVVNPRLVQDVEVVSQRRTQVLVRHSDLYEGDRREVDLLSK